MRAIICSAYGAPEQLTVGETLDPTPGPGEVCVRVACAGVNFPDTLIIQGQYQLKPPMPFSPGFEVAGDVLAVGSGVEGVSPGDRVMTLTASGYGGFAERVIAKAAGLVPIPPSIDDATAAAFYTAYGTAYHALVQRGALSAGEVLVVLGASSSVGLACVELGKALGATVIAVGSSIERLAIARDKGADHLLSHRDDDLKGAIQRLTGGAGADVCIDMVGGAPFDAMSRSMAWGGRLLTVGFVSGEIPRLPVNLPMLKGYSVVGVYWGRFVELDPEENRRNFAAMTELIEAGAISPRIDEVFSLEGTLTALRRVLDRAAKGKLVINVRHAGG